MKFDSIDQIKTYNWAGNAHSDAGAFRAIRNFVMDQSNSMADRAEALRQMSDNGMGCGRCDNYTDEDLVDQSNSMTS